MARHEEYLWRDPFGPSVSGAVLLSDHIHYLADEIGLVDPFKEKHLRPAAYDVRVGNCYYVDDEKRELGDNWIEIPPNGLVYVRTMEKFNIPYYLVARYSLRVQQVYRGLLIDNGLHIDPGYSGYIWIPVHNFTTQTRILLQGEEFISVEFNRTTPLPACVSAIKSEDELVTLGVQSLLVGAHSRTVKVFYRDLDRYKRRKEDFTPRFFWDKNPGELHKSGTLATGQRLDGISEEVKAAVGALNVEVAHQLEHLRNLDFLAVLGLVVALLAVLLPILYAEYGKSREVEAQQGAEIRDLRELLQEQGKRLEAITARQQTSAMPAASPGTRRARP